MVEKAKRLDNVRYDIRGPVSEEAERMLRQGVPIIKLNTGNPAAFGFEAPKYIPDIIADKLNFSACYAESRGIDEAREAIIKYSESKDIKGLELDDVFIGNGVSELIQISVQALVNEGDEILIPTPDYPLWTAVVNLCGGKVVHYMCDEQAEWMPDINDIKSKVTAKTKAIVVINPNNPTGALYPNSLLCEIIDLARKNGLIIFSDEIYDRLVMDELEHTAVAALADDVPVITFNGLSKSHQLCGYRCGWMVISGDKKSISGYLTGINMLASMRLCSNVPAQLVIKHALSDISFARHTLEPGGRLYEQREYVYSQVCSIPGLSAVKPKAAMYLFPKIDTDMYRINDDERFVLDFLREKHVLLTHGGSYNWKKPDHVRIVYLPEMEQLKEVVTRLGEFLSTYKQF